MRSACVLLLLACGVWPASALAQQEDQQTRDHEERDRRYLERYLKKPDTPVAVADPADAEQVFLQAAEELIRGRSYRSASSDHYRLQTDDPRVSAEGAVELLDAFRGFFDGYWAHHSELTTLEPYDKQSRVLLFYSFHKYNQLLDGDYRFSSNRPKGHYGSWYDVITLHSDAGSTGDLSSTLIHEAAHQLIEQRLGWQTAAPIWLSEGLASYFGFMLRDRSGNFQPARIGGQSADLFREGGAGRAVEARQRLTRFRKELRGEREGDALYARLLWSNDPATFYGEDSQLYYPASWMLVHYALHGEQSGHAKAFVSWLDGGRKGDGSPQALLDALGLDEIELEAAVLRHSRKL